MPYIQRTKEHRDIKDFTFTQSIIASGSYTTDAIDLDANYGINGYISMQLIVTGDGTIQVDYLLSGDGVNFISPTGASSITTNFTKTSGTDADGKDYFSITPPVTKYIKFKFTETGTANSANIDSLIVIQ